MNTENVGFNPAAFGASGWAKFGTSMISGTRASQMNEVNAAFDTFIGLVKKYGGVGPTHLLEAFNVKTIELNALTETIIDGKVTL